jgi:predicted transcriptional regulator
MTATMDARTTPIRSDRARIGRMRKVNGLGDLERAVMDTLWDSNAPQTVRQVHESLNRSRSLAYTTVMTVLQRLAKKGLVTQIRDDRAHTYQAAHQREDLVASLMVDVLDSADAPGSREAALVSFVGQVSADEVAALRFALDDLAARHVDHPTDPT